MGRILGIDYGEKRVGLAISDPDLTLAVPLRTVTIHDEAQLLREIKEACLDTEAGQIVIGMPFNMSGTKGPATEKVEKFILKLQLATQLPVDTWDERLSTSMVERSLIAADVSRTKRKGLRDKLAAQVILQSYLDAAEFRRLK